MYSIREKSRLLIMVWLCCTAALLRAQWLQQPFPTTEILYKVQFANSNIGWILGENGIYKTADGGKTWMQQNASTRFGNLLLALNENVVFYSGSFYSSTANATTGLRRTGDGGMTWHTVDSSYFRYFDADFVTDQVGYVSASDINFHPAILKTTDGGQTWKTVANNFSPANEELTGITFVDEQRGWAVSYDAMIFHTRDGGTTWTLQDSIRVTPPYFIPLRDIQFTTADSGWAVGGLSSNQLIVSTTNGGGKWSALSLLGCSLREVHFLNSQIGWTAGMSNLGPYMLQTKNGGVTWSGQTLQPPQTQNVGIESLSLLDGNNGWAVGWQGRVYKLGSVVSVETAPSPPNIAPAEFRLGPNLPNPVQTSTRFDYTISRATPIRLAVYDVLGREVALLFSGEKSPGVYSALWDGRDRHNTLMPNGVYFYRLQAGDLILTRKLVLLR